MSVFAEHIPHGTHVRFYVRDPLGRLVNIFVHE
jgi:hypothetical protein